MLRHAFCASHGIAISPTALMVKGDEAFCNVAGEAARGRRTVTLDELNAFEAAGTHLAFYQGAAI